MSSFSPICSGSLPTAIQSVRWRSRRRVRETGTGTTLHVRQSGWEDSTRWSRYYDLIATGFTVALEEMKNYVERKWKD